MTEMTKGVLRVFVTLMLAFGLVAGAASVAAQTEGGAGGDGATGGDVAPGTGDDNETSTQVNVRSQETSNVISVVGRDGGDGDVPSIQLLVRHLLALLASQPGFDVAAG
jgi:hypothetical protein